MHNLVIINFTILFFMFLLHTKSFGFYLYHENTILKVLSRGVDQVNYNLNALDF